MALDKTSDSPDTPSPIPSSPAEHVRQATLLVQAASARGILLRLFGGLAVYANCDSIPTHLALQRAYSDIDLVAPTPAWNELQAIFLGQGWVVSSRSPSQFLFEKAGIRAELHGPIIKNHHRFDLSERLALDPLTVSVSDLLLFKLQRTPLQDKDMQDAIALLLDHRVVNTDEPGSIGQDRITEPACRDYGLWEAVYGNTIRLEQVLRDYIEPDEAQLVWRRIEQIQGELDRHAKSLAWWSRALLSRKLSWYH